MKKILNSLLYYFLLFLGLVATSWIIYSRFIRERTIRDIPDSMLTEFRFWILLYICCIYMYSIRSLVKQSEGNPVINAIVDIIYTPLVMLDQSHKYNKIIKPYFIKIMIKLINLLKKLPPLEGLHKIIFMLQIFPRLVLVTILLIDTFYFHRIEIFYKFVLIGLLPFMLRYIKYTLKDFQKQMIKELEDKYAYISVYEKDFEPWKEEQRKKGTYTEDDWDDERKLLPTAPYHNKHKSIKEFIEIDFNNKYLDNTNYQYNGIPFCKDEIYTQYLTNKYKPKNIPSFFFNQFELLELVDIEQLDKLFYDYMLIIIEEKRQFLHLDYIYKRKSIQKLKILIFTLYLICWSFILLISYLHYPIELNLGKYYIQNLLMYLTTFEDPFCEFYSVSLNTNLLTEEILQHLLSKLKEKFL